MPEKKYDISGIYFYRESIHEEKIEVDKYTYDEVENKMEDYRIKLDEREERWNYWMESGLHETNAEKDYRRRDWTAEIVDEWGRKNKEQKYRSNLENQKMYEKFFLGYDVQFHFAGFAVFEKDRLLDILLSTEGIYTTNMRLNGSYWGREERSLDLEAPVKREVSVQELLRFMEQLGEKKPSLLPEMDYAAPMQPDFTLEEWGSWIFAHWGQ